MTRTNTHPSAPTRTVFSLSALALLITGDLLFAGPLDPPAGPIAPTAKPLAEIEPRTAINAANTPGDADSLYKITLPGSYYLTGNITGVIAKHGIEIAASGVTLDLSGFDLAGVAAMGAFDGVSVTVAGQTNIAVVNGSVRNWGRDGINFSNVTGCRMEGVRAGGNGRMGIYGGDNSQVAKCSGINNLFGIYVISGSTVSDCAASGNTGIGIAIESGSIANSAAYNNTGTGFSVGTGSTVINCSAIQNIQIGFNVGSGCAVIDCTTRRNGLDGIRCPGSGCVIRGNSCSSDGLTGDGAGIYVIALNGSRIEGNNCTGADRGIDVEGAGNIIIGNTCSGNTVNWDIVADNVCGPILDRTAPASAAILGNAAPDSTGSTHPNANFTY